MERGLHGCGWEGQAGCREQRARCSCVWGSLCLPSRLGIILLLQSLCGTRERRASMHILGSETLEHSQDHVWV